MTKKGDKKTTVTDALGREPFYPGLDKVNTADVLNTEFLLEDARYIPSWTSEFGDHPLVLMKGKRTGEDGQEQEFTTISSGEVVVKKVKELIEKRLFPLYATITFNRYYDIV